jgi:hypothetical protein
MNDRYKLKLKNLIWKYKMTTSTPKIIRRLFAFENPQEAKSDKSKAIEQLTDDRCHKKGKVIYEKKLFLTFL